MAFAVVRYAKAMCFVAQVLYHAQGFRFLVEIERHRIVGIIQLFEAFGNADDGDGATQTQLFEAFYCRRELSFAAIYHDKLR